MVGIESDLCLGLICNLNRNRSSVHILKVYSLTNLNALSTGKLSDLNCYNLLGVVLTIGLICCEMNVDNLSYFHLSYCSVEALDHETIAANELKGLSSVIGRIELLAVVEGSLVMYSAGLAYVLALEKRL